MESEVLFRRNVTQDQALNKDNWSEWSANCIYFTTNNTIVMNKAIYSGKSTIDLVIKGDWDKEAAYVQNNIVYHNNNSYICLQDISQPKVGDTPIEPGTTVGEAYWGLFAKSANLYISTTYAELKILISKNSLIPGCKYRITDYYTSYDCSNTKTNGQDITDSNYTVQCTNHRFDVVVTANSENTLSQDATARHNVNDTYFVNCNVESWQLKYNIDNDVSLSKLCYNGTALTPNGNGIIYRMIDEYGNDLPFDFKNIQFKRLDPSNGNTTSQWFATADIFKRMLKRDFVASKYNDPSDIFIVDAAKSLKDDYYLNYSTLGNNVSCDLCPKYDENYLYMKPLGIEYDYVWHYHDSADKGSWMYVLTDLLDDSYPKNAQPKYDIPGTTLICKMGSKRFGDYILTTTPWFYVFSMYDGSNWVDRTVYTSGSDCTAQNNKFNSNQNFENTVFLGSALNNTFGSSVKDNTFSGGFENNTFLYDCVANAFMASDNTNCTKNCNFDYIHNSIFIGKHEYNTFTGENHNFFIIGNSSHNEFNSCYNILGNISSGCNFDYCSFGSQCHDIRISDAYSCVLGSECNHINIGSKISVMESTSAVLESDYVDGTHFVIFNTSGTGLYKAIDMAAKTTNVSTYSYNKSELTDRYWSVRVEPGVTGNCTLAEWDDPRNYYDISHGYNSGSQISEALYKISQKGTVVETTLAAPKIYIAKGSFNMVGLSVKDLDGTNKVLSSVLGSERIGDWEVDQDIPLTDDALGYASYPIRIAPTENGSKLCLSFINNFTASKYWSGSDDQYHMCALRVFRIIQGGTQTLPYEEGMRLVDVGLYVDGDSTARGDGVMLDDDIKGRKIWFEIPRTTSTTKGITTDVILFIPAANTEVLAKTNFKVDYTIERV